MGTEKSLDWVAKEGSCEEVVFEVRPQRREGVKVGTTWELREQKGESLWIGDVLSISKNRKSLGLEWSRSSQRHEESTVYLKSDSKSLENYEQEMDSI